MTQVRRPLSSRLAPADFAWVREFALGLAIALFFMMLQTGAWGTILRTGSKTPAKLASEAAEEKKARAAPFEPPVLEGTKAKKIPADHRFDTVIMGGRVIDPESRTDAMVNVGIDNGKVRAISDKPLKGRRVIDATGRVVAPGFIDIESYDPNPYGIWFKIADGVTTNLGMHGSNGRGADWYGQWGNAGSPAHFGGAFDANFARSNFLQIEPYESATPDQIQQLVQMAEEGLDGGFIGVEFSPEYAPGMTFEELKAVTEVAARYNVPAFIHGRYSDTIEPGTNSDTIDEVIRLGKETGAKVHLLHINSTGGTFTMEKSLASIEAARKDGVKLTSDTYPYDFWATYLASARFDPGWQERFRISYDDLVIPGTGERLTESTFERYQKQTDPLVLAAAYAIPAEDVKTALRSPFVMIGSDAILEPGDNNHPRGAGTFARTLAKYVREDKVISLTDGLAKMTSMPAQLLDDQVPALKRKGRLQIGSDADITIFDP